MVMEPTTEELSRGPVLVERAVHIIIIPDGVAGVSRSSEAMPNDAQLAEAAKYVNIGNPALTDVIVFAGRPWHFADGKMRKHPDVHLDFPTTVLELNVGRDEKALWWSESPFAITQIVSRDPLVQAPYPFTVEPVTRQEEGVDHPARTIHVARSTVPVEGARGHEYKITFTVNGRSIDPNMRCL